MDESVLKIVLDNLERSRSSLDTWLNISTLLVVVGVALEVIFVILEYQEELKDFRRGFVHPPYKPSKRKFVLELLVAGLVAIGVAGELYIEARIGTVETEIREANDRRALLLSKEAGDAKISAEGAASASSRAQRSADAANIAAGEAVRKSNEANAAASSALEKLRGIEWYADVIANSVSPRLLDCGASRKILMGKPRGTAEIWYEPNDLETKRFAQQLHDCFGPDGAGWTVADIQPLSGGWSPDKYIPNGQISVDSLRMDAFFSVGNIVIVRRDLDTALDFEGKTAGGALDLAIRRGMGLREFGGAMPIAPSLPDNHFVIVVGRHSINVPIGGVSWQDPLHPKKPKNSAK